MASSPTSTARSSRWQPGWRGCSSTRSTRRRGWRPIRRLAAAGRLTRDDTVVFLHTGGLPALFAYGSEVLRRMTAARLLVADRVIDGTGADPIADGGVLVEGETIVAVGPAARLRRAGLDEERPRGRDDPARSHRQPRPPRALGRCGSRRHARHVRGRPLGRPARRSGDGHALAALGAGITTLRDCGSTLAVLRVRDAIRDGRTCRAAHPRRRSADHHAARSLPLVGRHRDDARRGPRPGPRPRSRGRRRGEDHDDGRDHDARRAIPIVSSTTRKPWPRRRPRPIGWACASWSTPLPRQPSTPPMRPTSTRSITPAGRPRTAARPSTRRSSRASAARVARSD